MWLIIPPSQPQQAQQGWPVGLEELISTKFDWLSKTGIESKAALKTKCSVAKADEQTNQQRKRV